MKKTVALLLAGLLLAGFTEAQLLTWSPAFPKDDDTIVITLDAGKGNQGLFNYPNPDNIYVHTGVTTNLSNNGGQQWLYVNGSTGGAWGGTTLALKATSPGSNTYQYTINNIRAFFGVPPGETIKKIAILFRDANINTSLVKKAANTDGSDMYIPVYDNNLALRFSVPFFQPTFNSIPEPFTKQVGDNISLTALANHSSTMKLFLNGTEIQTAPNVTTLSANPLLTTGGNQIIIAEANDGVLIKRDTIQFFITITPPVLPLPAGVRDGINYEAGDTSVTLVLYAPGKTRVSVIGEFPGSNWVEQTGYVMNNTADGHYWWLRIPGLTPGMEYAFQYLVDGTLKVGEPYCEKILDPVNDPFISGTTYPGLKPYPTGQTTGIVSVLQTGPPSYTWAVSNFPRPDKRNLVVYELLLRDFIAAHDWKTLKDTLNYFRALGINAIEIMPFNEFEGNESWGYNPDYFLAPDKYYGTKNSLKEFIDSCHSKGIAVLMDIALNHTTGSNPLAALYWNSTTNQPAADNPWLNVTARHPFNVFNDFNHESMATRYFTSRVVEYWLQEYKMDGFRFDLSKGFTQNAQCGGSTSDVNCWGQYDASRIAIWKRYYDTLQAKSPGSYAILEHFAVNAEEIELSNYGMLLWGNANYNFTEASMGYVPTSNFESFLHTSRGWTNPFLVGYMESHDEERMMYKNLQFGNSSGSYSTKDLNTGLKRIELCAAFLLTAPGPKMIWEFGELGYDQSINRCVNGTIDNNCRLDNKPILWNYQQVASRNHLYGVFASLNQLRFHPLYKDVFIANAISLTNNLGAAFKSMTIRSAADSSMLCVVGNFDVIQQTGSFTFPKSGTWFDYLNGTTLTATGAAQNITLQPGEYHVYLNRNLGNVAVPPTDTTATGADFTAVLYPNPVQPVSKLDINLPEDGTLHVNLFNSIGQKIINIYSGNLTRGKHTIPLTDNFYNLPAGIYLMQVQSVHKSIPLKLVIQ